VRFIVLSLGHPQIRKRNSPTGPRDSAISCWMVGEIVATHFGSKQVPIHNPLLFSLPIEKGQV
jgi:hypothetical protein